MAAGEEENVLYRGEGIRNLVLSHIKDKQVYRLQKIVQKYNTDGYIDENQSEEERSLHIHENLQGVVNFIHNVMQPLLSTNFVAVPKLTQIPKGFVEKIESEIEHLRPVYRKIHDEDFKTIDPATCSALVLPDLCFVGGSMESAHHQKNYTPTISVEIKPKKGFMPSSECLDKDDVLKGRVCKFCMHKRLKEKEGRWSNSSHYCPIDLFSGDRQRMKHALLSLYDTPQNNFKIFLDGQEVFSETTKEDLSEILQSFFRVSGNGLSNGLKKHHDFHTLLDLTIDALLCVPEEEEKSAQSCPTESKQANRVHYNGACASNGHASSHVTKPYSTNVCANSTFPSTDHINTESLMSLAPMSVLGRILCTQQLDDASDIDGVYPLYQKVKEHLKSHPEDRSKFGVYGPFTRESWLEPCTQKLDTKDTASLEYAVYKVKRFIVSKTMQDCSIMVAIQRCPSCSPNKDAVAHPCLSDGHGGKFHFSVSIIDLDPKPFNKLTKYHQLERSIVEAYTEQTM